MDADFREVTRRLAAGDPTAAMNYVMLAYRKGFYPQDVFDELATYIGKPSAEVLLVEYHQGIKTTAFNALKSINETTVRQISFLLTSQDWFTSATEEHEGFPDMNHTLLIRKECEACGGGGIATHCSICEADHPCVHYNNVPSDPAWRLVTPNALSNQNLTSGSVVIVVCPYCNQEHMHQYSMQDGRVRMAPRLADCGRGEYEIQIPPNCIACKASGQVIDRRIPLFHKAFYRYVWDGLLPPGFQRDDHNWAAYGTRGACTLLLEEDMGYGYAVLRGSIAPAGAPQNRNLTSRVRVDRENVIEAFNEVYRQAKDLHLGL